MNELQLHTLLEQASRFCDDGKHLHAIQVLNTIVQRRPTCDKAYILLAQVYMEMDRLDQAEKILLRGFHESGKNLEYALLLGNLHLQQSHFDEALRYFRSLKHLDVPQIHQSIGLIYLNQGNLEQAEQELRRAVVGGPDLPRIHELLAEVLLRQEKTGEAAGIIGHALRRDPYSGSAHRLMGTLHAKKREWAKAFEEFAYSVDCDPDDFELWYLAAISLVQMEKFSEARKYLEHAYERNPHAREVLDTLAFVLTRLGDLERVSALHKTFEQDSPEHGALPMVHTINNTP